MDEYGTVFNDPVHGYIELEPLLMRIIHTPEFQRMKDIKQLGATYWVYPGASHNRFEHSLGTAYLAGKMIETLRHIHKGEIEITDEEVLCVKIAALCHDLGHGPFSHVFDTQMKEKLIKLHRDEETKLLNQARDANMEKSLKFHREQAMKLQTWEHEDASCEMFDHMLKANPELYNALEEKKICENERNLVKELIKGKLPGTDKVTQMAKVDGVDHAKWFLFEIVANKRNGIDCDKFDYFARDCLNLGVKSNFDHLRYFQNVRILPVDGELQLGLRDKLVFNIYELFHTRWSLHHRVYQHKTTKAIEDMITDAFTLLDHKYNFSTAISDMEEYAKLTDSIFYEIIRSKDQDESTKKAQEIVRRIQRRELYKFCGETQPTTKLDIGALEVAEEIASFDSDLSPDELFISIIEIHFGMKEKDPVESVVFYNKNFNKAVQLRKNIVSEMLPQKFSEQYVRVYGKNLKQSSIAATPGSKAKEERIVHCFQEWCKSREYASPDELSGDKTGYFTPAKDRKRRGSDRKESSNPSKKRLYTDMK